MITIDMRSNQPIYEQIVRQYRYMILQGYLKPGDDIPSVRKLALSLSITPGTVAKAYGELERSHVIETIRGKGTFIAKDVRIDDAVRDERKVEKMREQMENACMEMIYQGMKKEEIMEMVSDIMEHLLKGEGKDD